MRPELADSIVDALNAGFVPQMRTLGSVGQADLGPMADLAASLLERGDLELEENEGLALLDNNAFSTGSAALAVAGRSSSSPAPTSPPPSTSRPSGAT